MHLTAAEMEPTAVPNRKKVIISCLALGAVSLLVSLDSFGQEKKATPASSASHVKATPAKHAAGNKPSAKLAKKDVPEVIIAEFDEEVPVTEYVDWYSYPVFYDDWGWYTIDPVYEVVEEVPEFYLIEYVTAGTPHKAIYSKAGKKMAVRRKVKDAELPKAVTEALKTGAYKDWKVTGDKEEIMRVADQKKVYKVSLEKGADKKVVLFDGTGKVVHAGKPGK